MGKKRKAKPNDIPAETVEDTATSSQAATVSESPPPKRHRRSNASKGAATTTAATTAASTRQVGRPKKSAAAKTTTKTRAQRGRTVNAAPTPRDNAVAAPARRKPRPALANINLPQQTPADQQTDTTAVIINELAALRGE